ncbi:hypothetical protein CERSUDRAFT_85268 [Gelatoporia subvermispora B]|uniref:Uncharacterized protein n=1 Tax=Ceriporiopsis subvermispora (strain B) TaxID=914234 RepID=M2R9X6_CERS8|nr:hypothetical protein CERSUDRAFT_85268 [Gelatoporia subvermispora B]
MEPVTAADGRRAFANVAGALRQWRRISYGTFTEGDDRHDHDERHRRYSKLHVPSATAGNNSGSPNNSEVDIGCYL